MFPEFMSNSLSDAQLCAMNSQDPESAVLICSALFIAKGLVEATLCKAKDQSSSAKLQFTFSLLLLSLPGEAMQFTFK